MISSIRSDAGSDRKGAAEDSSTEDTVALTNEDIRVRRDLVIKHGTYFACGIRSCLKCGLTRNSYKTSTLSAIARGFGQPAIAEAASPGPPLLPPKLPPNQAYTTQTAHITVACAKTSQIACDKFGG